ncbi:hypothetical protein [Halorussus litoreus]|nr:hypothetical protein [Halorussus litoreus]
MTTYVPTDKLADARALEHVEVKVVEEYEHEYLISVTAPST